MSAPVIRSASATDVARLVELLQHGALDPGREDPSQLGSYRAALREIQSVPGCDVLVAELDGEVVGMCQFVVFRHFQARGGRCAELESMHVHPDHRGKGIGGLLLQRAVDRARHLGCYRVQLTSNGDRSDAHRFYRRHGFTATHLGFKLTL